MARKKDAQNIPPMKKRRRCCFAQSESQKAAELNGQFTDMFYKSQHSQTPLLDRSIHIMEDIVVTKEGVTKLLKCLNPFKALGPDELHPKVLKELATELNPIFAHLFQQSVDLWDPKGVDTCQHVTWSRWDTDNLLAIIVRFPWLVYLANYSNTLHVYSNIMTHLDEHKLLSYKQDAIRR